jgi:hypothetical protein
MIDVIRALDTGITLCCSVRQHSLEIQASGTSRDKLIESTAC